MKKIIIAFLVLFASFGCSKDEIQENIVPLTPVVYKSVQKRLNENETPLSIYKSGISIDSLYGKTYKGGLIYYFEINNGTGLIASNVNNSTGINWRPYTPLLEPLPSLYAIDTFIGSGESNTQAIVDKFKKYNSYTAAQLCDDLVFNGYSDWFLPSKDEMYTMMNRLQGKIDIGAYWTSSNYNESKVWIVNRYPIGSELSNKWDSSSPNVKIRATRKF
jgi:hypothetical protein